MRVGLGSAGLGGGAGVAAGEAGTESEVSREVEAELLSDKAMALSGLTIPSSGTLVVVVADEGGEEVS